MAKFQAGDRVLLRKRKMNIEQGSEGNVKELFKIGVVTEGYLVIFSGTTVPVLCEECDLDLIEKSWYEEKLQEKVSST